MEKMQWRHQQELAEMKHNTDLLLMELRQNLKAEEQKVVADIKKQADIEKNRAVAETKKKQWCAHCGKEAIFYCCWNTSYCDYPCQVSITSNYTTYIIYKVWLEKKMTTHFLLIELFQNVYTYISIHVTLKFDSSFPKLVASIKNYMVT